MSAIASLVTADTLSHLGHVPTAYRHEWRVATPGDPLVTTGSVFKWYGVHREDAAIPAALQTEARELLAAACRTDGWDLEYGLNFAVLHLSTRHAFLIVGMWRNHQELWRRVAIKELASAGPLAWERFDAVDAPSACVWEFGPIVHERMAWHRYLFSDRGDPEKRAWLADTYGGRV